MNDVERKIQAEEQARAAFDAEMQRRRDGLRTPATLEAGRVPEQDQAEAVAVAEQEKAEAERRRGWDAERDAHEQRERELQRREAELEERAAASAPSVNDAVAELTGTPDAGEQPAAGFLGHASPFESDAPPATFEDELPPSERFFSGDEATAERPPVFEADRSVGYTPETLYTGADGAPAASFWGPDDDGYERAVDAAIQGKVLRAPSYWPRR